jgi:hypothetical protein
MIGVVPASAGGSITPPASASSSESNRSSTLAAFARVDAAGRQRKDQTAP